MKINREAALQYVVSLDTDSRKLLLRVLLEEMNQDDQEEVLGEEGWVAE
jgi:hypothetical protein